MKARPLKISGLGRTYGYRHALRDVHMEFGPGEISVVLGPNGAGKSTLLHSIVSRSAPDSGAIFFLGKLVQSVEQRSAFLARCGFLGHRPGLFLDLSARQNLRFFLSLYKKDLTAEDDKRIDSLLERTGLLARAADAVRTFSRGMQQRLGIARVFLIEPDIALFDEPLTGLDLPGERVLKEMLLAYRQGGGTAIVATHDEPFFRPLGDRFAFIQEGQLIADIPNARYSQKSREHVMQMLYHPQTAKA